MPELPDVEGYRRALADELTGRTVRRTQVLDAGVLHGVTPAALGRLLHGARFGTPRRHGKWLIIPTRAGSLLVHSGMTGRPHVVDTVAPERFDRVVLHLDRGAFVYTDQRKLRGLWWAADDTAIERITGPLGPDALGIGRTEFAARLEDRRGVLKAVLTDQAVLAGLGNLLADEICWQARLNPLIAVDALSGDDVAQLHRTTGRVLRTAVRHGCVPRLRTWLTGVRDDAAARCPRCHVLLERDRVRGRMTVWCPRSQPRRRQPRSPRAAPHRGR